MKIITTICKLIFIICIPAILLSGSLAWGFNSKWLYNYGFQKYNVSDQTGFSSFELDQAAEDLIKYFNSKDEYVNIILYSEDKPVELFTAEEKYHFKDVKQLFKLDYLVFYSSLLIILILILVSLYWKKGVYRIQLAKNLIWGSGISIFLVIVIGISSFFDFEGLFLKFHYLVFTNDYWSAPGYMLLLFPGGFWYDAALFCLALMIILAIILGLCSVLYMKLLKKKRINK